MSGLAETRIDTVDIDDSGNPDRLSIVDYSDAANRKLSIITAADTVASRYGLLTFGSDGTNVRPLLTNTGGRLQVDVISGGTAGQQVADGQLATGGNPANDFGNIAVGWDGTNYQFVATNTGGRLQVDIVSGGSGGSQYADGTLIAGTIGNVAMGTDGANLQFLKTDTAGELQVDVLTLPSVTQGTSPWVVSGTVTANAGTGPWPVTDNGGALTVDNAGTFAVQAAQSGTWTVEQGTPPWSVDVTDRAVRLLGVVYGSQGQQLKQTATNFNLQSELAVGGTLIDPRSIRALLATDVVSAELTKWIGSVAPTVGQKTMVASIPVTIASDQPSTGVSSPASLVDANKFYSIGTDVNMVTAGTDNPILLLRNPTGSGIKIYIWKMVLGSTVTNVAAEFKVWAQPTITTNGTAITTVSRHIGGGAPTAKLLVNSLPTVSSNGTLLAVNNVGQNTTSVPFDDEFTLELEPNTSILLTGSPGSNNRNAAITIIWAEDI